MAEKKWRCPKGCEIEKAIVCGGDAPNYRRIKKELGNIYFFTDLDGEYLREPYTETGFTLTEQDWRDMEEHADGGCCEEPQCPECFEYLERI